MGVNIPVRVGQVWADGDRRMKGRTIEVVAIDPEKIRGERYALVRVLTDRDSNTNPTVGQTRRILLRRIRPGSTGYVLVKDV